MATFADDAFNNMLKAKPKRRLGAGARETATAAVLSAPAGDDGSVAVSSSAMLQGPERNGLTRDVDAPSPSFATTNFAPASPSFDPKPLQFEQPAASNETAGFRAPRESDFTP